MTITTAGHKIEINLEGDSPEVQGIVTHMIDLIRVLVMLSDRTNPDYQIRDRMI